MSLRPRFVVAALTALFPALLAAQAQVGVNVGDSARINVAPNAKFSVPVYVQPSGGAIIAALTTTFTWGQAIVTLDSIKAGALGWPVTPNLANALTGSASASTFDANGTSTKGSYALLWFTAPATTGGTHVNVTPTAAGNDIGTSILAQLVPRGMDICVAPAGKWGDVNGDTHVDIIDAQQIARFSVGLSAAAGVTTAGDVNADTHVDIIDAQQIARFSVGLSASARTNTTLFTPPTVSVLSVNNVYDVTPGTPANTPINLTPVAVGKLGQIVPLAKDAGNNDVTPCAQVNYVSSQPSVATVSSSGLITAVAPGTTQITMSSGATSALPITVTVVAATGGAVATLEFVDGADLASYAGVQTGQPARIRAKNAVGGVVSGATVTFSLTAGSGLIGPVGTTLANGAQAAPVQVTTDANGVATILLWAPNAAPNVTTITAASTGATSLPFNFTAVPSRIGSTTCFYDGYLMRCWGENSRGQMGNGQNTNMTTPYPVTMTGITLPANPIFSKEGFGDHTCLLDNAGAAWCWGSNGFGQVGDSTYTNRNVPTKVKTAQIFQSIVTGGDHTCALTTTGGQVWCWGENFAGELGDSTFSTRRYAPVQVKAGGLVFTTLASGTNHVCAGTAAGVWYCWGLNASGQLGDGTTINRATPVQAAGGAVYAQLALGEGHSCGLTAGGVASCWGNQFNGALGNGSATFGFVTSPTAVTGSHVFTKLYSGNAHSCGIKADFEVWCWGWNNGGQNGDSSLVNRPDPVRAAFTGSELHMGGTNLASSPQYTCGLTTTAQQTFCWGANFNGALGDGTTVNKLAPVLVNRFGGTAGAPTAVSPVNPFTVGSLAVGTAAPAPGAQVLVRDETGVPVVGATVTWKALTGGITFAGAVTQITSQTDATGTASSGAVTFGGTPGFATMEASVSGTGPGGPGLVRHVIGAYLTPAPANFVKFSGDSVFYGGINSTNATVPMKVQVTDGSSNPIANTPVQFSLGPNSGTLNGSNAPVTVLTDANGIATLPGGAWVINTAVPNSTLHAQANQGAVDLVFTGIFSPNGAVNPLTSCDLNAAGLAYCWGVGTQGNIGNGANAQANAPTAVSGGLVFTSLASGDAAHHCGLVGNTAYCWGNNDAGQVGDGTNVNKNVPTQVLGGLSFSSLAIGGLTTCGITTANALYCWGWSTSGGFDGPANQSTRGRTFWQPHLVVTGGLTFTKVTVADDAVCGLTAAGAIYCRGRSAGGWNLDNTTDDRTTFSQALGGPWKDVSALYIGICAIDNSDHVFCAGADQNLGSLGNGLLNGTTTQLQLTQTAGNTTFASIHNYHFGACARRTTGDVYCWGSNGFGQTGVGAQLSTVLQPTQIPGVQFTSIRPMGFRTVCGKVASGLEYCWGQNSNGQVGVGSASQTTFLNPVAVSGWTDGPAAGTAVTAVPTTSTTFSGIGSQPVTLLPQVMVRDKAFAPVAGVTVNFTVAAGGGNVTGGSVQTDASGIATVGSWTLGSNVGANNNVLYATVAGLPSVSFAYSATAAPSTVTLAAGDQQVQGQNNSLVSALSVLVKDASNNPVANVAVTWTLASGSGTLSSGTNGFTLSNANGIASATFITPGANGNTTVNATVAGFAAVPFSVRTVNPTSFDSRCEIATAGAAYCWGANNRGQMGDGTTVAKNVPTAVLGGIQFASIADGGDHTCGLTAAGAAYCWGANAYGELGDGTIVDKLQPTLVTGGLTFTKLAVSPASTCGIISGGQMYCWGSTSWGFGGDNVFGQARTAPTQVVTAATFIKFAMSATHICAITNGSQVMCWGFNGSGQLGDNTSVSHSVPALVSGGSFFNDIAAGQNHTCGVASGGTVLCWGNGSSGQMGFGNTNSNFTPAPLFGNNTYTAIAASVNSNCAIQTTTNQAFCWGSNSFGQIGDGTSGGTRLTATPVVGGVPFTSIKVRNSTACGDATGGQPYCWGLGTGGQIGNALSASVSQPEPVKWVVGTAAVPVSLVATTLTTTTGTHSAAVVTNPQVKVRDYNDIAVSGVTVTWTVVLGGGNVATATSITDASGLATAPVWTLGAGVGAINTLTASASGTPTVTFTVTGN